MTKHSKLGASSAKRWINCPGSVALIGEGHADGGATVYSAGGTAAHLVAGECLDGVGELWEAHGRKFTEDGHETVLDDEDLEAVQVYLTYCENLRKTAIKTWVEHSFDLKEYHPDFYGTLDFAAQSGDGRTLDCVDYKHGAGVVVDIEHNEQLMYYACGVLHKALDAEQDNAVDKIRLTIVQPRAACAPIRTWEISKYDLILWLRKTLVPAAKRTEEPDALLKAGDWCQFCKARKFCPEMGSTAQDIADASLVPVRELSDEEVGRLLDLLDIAMSFRSELNSEAYQRQMHGRRIPGRKLVASKVNRVWKDGAEDAAINQLWNVVGDIYIEPKFKGPAQIEKLPTGKAFVTKWAYKPEAGLSLVKSSDPKPEVTRSAVDAFAGIEE